MDIIIFLIKSKGNHRSNQRMFVNAVGRYFFALEWRITV
nr:MAG TPA: hypothetical protein [Bacteriophage sp.]